MTPVDQKNREINRARNVAFLGIALIIILMAFAFATRNFEFVYYDAILIPLAIISYGLYRRLRFPLSVFCLIFFVFLLHAAGGVVYLNHMRLYDIPLWIFHYDNIVHFFGSLATSLVIYSLLYDSFHSAWIKHKGLAFLLIVLGTAGAGTFVEIIEFFAVLILQDKAGVGGYVNNAIDLVVNFSAACTGAFMTVVGHSKHNK